MDADDDPTPQLTEGPYFTPNSPKRRSIVPAGAAGTRLTLSGRVLTTGGKPIPNALIDFWQADARGAYDNRGYRFRGHQFTNAKGQYSLFSVVPGLYPGRTKHIHVKVQAPREPVLTTQLFFPGVAGNRSDGIFDTECLVTRWRLSNGRRLATFDFVLDV
jgi:protocatechuate 3,4-dioxygenase beta subunit